MFNLSGTEIVVILLLALVVLGPEKLPEAIRRAGRTYAELKKMGSGFQAEVRSAFDEPMQEMRETADLLRKATQFDDKPSSAGPTLRRTADDALAPVTGDARDEPVVSDEPSAARGDLADELDELDDVDEPDVDELDAADEDDDIDAIAETVGDEPDDVIQPIGPVEAADGLADDEPAADQQVDAGGGPRTP